MLKVAHQEKVETKRIFPSQSVRFSGSKTEVRKSNQPQLSEKGRGQEAEGRRGQYAGGFNQPAIASHQIEDCGGGLIPLLPTVARSTRAVPSALCPRTSAFVKFPRANPSVAATASQRIKKAQSFTVGKALAMGRLSRPLTGWKPITEAAVSHVNSEQHLSYRVERKSGWRRRADINEETFMAIRIQTLQEVKSINFKIPHSDDTVQVIYSNSIPDLVEHYAPGEQKVKAILNAYLKNLKIYAEINSLTAVTIPDFSVVATRAAQQKIALEYEWNSPRFELRIVSSSNGVIWTERGKISLINSEGYPYRLHDALDLLTSNLAEEIGGDSQLCVQIVDVGYGLPTSVDKITISGSVTEEIHFVQSSLNVFV
ncbi:MAG: hypothetical protein F6J89_02180 [Symploca sp. SIO1C4]|uniref:Uncharacterized protein n=1 Tax=Symploca sp. SIO1C4 TaxID=2607765 RepID=A0A6B3N012_9CYAN|nr:hypothetical protein [Symploca sp. SIO1C4]